MIGRRVGLDVQVIRPRGRPASSDVLAEDIDDAVY